MENNGNWKGGRIFHKQGYVMVRMPASNDDLRRYVFDHVLIMEEHLGRKLLPTENVHHINGVRDDNRIENLELWVTPQPTGIRAVDALDWAREIIKLYG